MLRTTQQTRDFREIGTEGKNKTREQWATLVRHATKRLTERESDGPIMSSM